MATLNILSFEDKALRCVSRPVEKITGRVLRLLDDMRETLEKSGGVGLAAPQVGVLRRVAIVDDGEKVVELINPEIIRAEGLQEDVEGCLSYPSRWGITKRPAAVTVRAADREGKPFEISGTELVARCLCHEVDHLNGVLFVDKVIRMLTEEEIANM